MGDVRIREDVEWRCEEEKESTAHRASRYEKTAGAKYKVICLNDKAATNNALPTTQLPKSGRVMK